METTEEVALETKPIQASSPVKSEDKIAIEEEEKIEENQLQQEQEKKEEEEEKKDEEKKAEEEAPPEKKEEEPAKRKSLLKFPAILKRKSQEPSNEEPDAEKGEGKEEEDKEKKENRRSRIFPEIKIPTIIRPKEQKTETTEGEDPAEAPQGPVQRPKFWHNLNLPPVPAFLKRSSTTEMPDEEKGNDDRSGSPSKELNDDNKAETKMLEEVKLELTSEKPIEPEEKEEFSDRLLKQMKGSRPLWYILIAIGLVLLAVIVLVAVYVSKSSHRVDWRVRIIDGKYVRAVTSCGWIQGLVDPPGFSFLGVPYANPPVGDKRWLPSDTQTSISQCGDVPVLTYNHSIPCWHFSENGNYDGVEDCLKLDIYTPKVSYDSPLPVVVLISSETLNGGLVPTLRPSTELATKKSVVMVHIQYRLSVIGFLSLKKFMNNERPPRSGNYGLSDVHTALKWIKLNIEHFGGDPDAVTLLGHGAGATLTTAALSSVKFKGLFKQVWMTGGSGYMKNLSLDAVDEENKLFLDGTDCSDTKCLRELSGEELMESVPEEWKRAHRDLPMKDETQHPWLVIDGDYMRGTFRKQWEEKGKIDVPTVIGMNKHQDVDMSLYVNNEEQWETEQVAQRLVKEKLGTISEEIADDAIKMYQRGEEPWGMYTQMVSDIRTVCPLLEMARDIASNFDSKVFAYVSTHPRNNTPDYTTDGLSDIQAILGVYEQHDVKDTKYVEVMQKEFFNFVYRGFMTDNQRVPRNLYLLSESMKNEAKYPNCDYWTKSEMYPKYARID